MPDNIEIPQSLKEALKNKTVIPFIGAGVSMTIIDNDGNRIFPSWKELLLKAADKLVEENKPSKANLVRALVNDEPPDFYQAAEKAKDGLGHQIWMEFLKSNFNPEKSRINNSTLELAKCVWKLGSNLIITSNYDRVLRWACPNLDDLQTWTINTPHGHNEIARNVVTRPTVWHLHGHVDEINEIILTPDGYRNLYTNNNSEIKYRGALETLRTVLRSKNLIFIGFSLNDPDFVKQIEWVKDTFQGFTGPHYILVRASEKSQIIEKFSGLSIIPITFTDFGEPLIQLLNDLSTHTSNP